MDRCCRKCVACLTSHQNYYWLLLIQRLTEFLMKWMLKFIGPVMLIFGNVLILTVIGLYVTLWHGRSWLASMGQQGYLKEYYKSQINSSSKYEIWSVVNTFICFILGFNLYYNYIKCITTKPGSPSSCEDLVAYFGKSVIGIIDGKKIHSIKARLDVSPGVSYRYCKICKCIKPPRCHHCSVLGRCVYHMDHFCPWVNNTIGYYNYRYFVLFLLYTLLASTHIFISMLLEPLRSSLMKSGSSSVIKAIVVFVFTITLASSLSVGILLGWHVYLILTNQTTIEFYTNYELSTQAAVDGNVFKNPYDNGWKKNIKRVFGDVPWQVALLPSTRLPPEPEYQFELTKHPKYSQV